MPPTVDENSIEKIIKGITIPSPPQVVVDLQMAMYDPTPDLNAIAETIEKDPGLSGGVLKLINSPIFGLNSKVTSVREASLHLGFKTISMLVNSLCLRSEVVTESLTQDEQHFLNRFWDSCSDIATISAMVAEKANISRYRDDAYLLGLFHNVGIALLYQRFKNYPSTLHHSYGPHNKRIVDIENEELSTNHAVVGYYIAKSWKTPPWIAEAIAKHHSAEEVLKASNDERLKTLISILKTAEHLTGVYQMLGDQTENYEWEKISYDVLAFLGLTQDDCDDIASKAQDMGMGCNNILY